MYRLSTSIRTLQKCVVELPPSLPAQALHTSSRLQFDPSRPGSSAHPSPNPPRYPGHVPINFFQRSLLALGSAFASITNTYRHDMVAVLSETTGGPFLAKLRTQIRSTPSGRSLLRERPRITEQSVNVEQLALLPEGSFGREYVNWLRRNKVTPDTRDPVRYIDDEELAYIMQRYRESHDFYHVLLGFGVSLPSELVVKWFELANFGLPVAFLSSVFGPLRMEKGERRRLMATYGTWALRAGSKADCLIGVEWEKQWEKPLVQLKRELGIDEPPVPFKVWRKENKRIKEEAAARKRNSSPENTSV